MAMFSRTTVFTIVGSVGLLGLILALVRAKLLKEKYSLIWLFTALVLVVLSISKGPVEKLAALMGIYYAPSALFLLAFLFLILITVQFSVVMSKLSERNKVLTQEIALLKLRVDELAQAKRDKDVAD
jgi:hypothetical protein